MNSSLSVLIFVRSQTGGLSGRPSDAHHIMVFQHLHKTDPVFKRPSDPVFSGRSAPVAWLKAPQTLTSRPQAYVYRTTKKSPCKRCITVYHQTYKLIKTTFQHPRTVQ